MGHIRRNQQEFTVAQNDFTVVKDQFQSSGNDPSDLFVYVRMARNDCAAGEKNAREHSAFAEDHLARDFVVEFLGFEFRPREFFRHVGSVDESEVKSSNETGVASMDVWIRKMGSDCERMGV